MKEVRKPGQVTERTFDLTENTKELSRASKSAMRASHKNKARLALYFLRNDIELNIYRLTEKIKERLKKIENESLSSGHRLILMSVEKFKQSIFVVQNPEDIVLQKQLNSDRVIACWYENGEIKREELKKELKYIVPYDQFPTRIGIEDAVKLIDSNLVEKITGNLGLYDSHWSDSIPLSLRNFFKKVGLFFRTIFQATPSSPDTPDFEDKNTHINRNFINLDIMNVLKFYQEEWGINSATIKKLSAQRETKKINLQLIQNELQTAKDNPTEFVKTARLENKFNAELTEHVEQINRFENTWDSLVIQSEKMQKKLDKINSLIESNYEFLSDIYDSDGHENKDLNTITKELIESLADGIPDELVYAAYPHLANKT